MPFGWFLGLVPWLVLVLPKFMFVLCVWRVLKKPMNWGKRNTTGKKTQHKRARKEINFAMTCSFYARPGWIFKKKVEGRRRRATESESDIVFVFFLGDMSESHSRKWISNTSPKSKFGQQQKIEHTRHREQVDIQYVKHDVAALFFAVHSISYFVIVFISFFLFFRCLNLNTSCKTMNNEWCNTEHVLKP